MRRLSILITLFGISLIASAQNLENHYTTEIDKEDLTAQNAEYLLDRVELNPGSKGSPTVFERSRRGTIYFADGSRAADIPINYDCFNNTVLYFNEGSNSVVNDKLVEYLAFEGEDEQTVFFKRMLRPGKKKMIFMEVIFEGDHCGVYKRHFRTFIKSDPSGAYSSNATRAEYIHKSELFIRVGDAEPLKLKPSKKFFVKTMSNSGKQVEAFIEQESLDLQSDDHLAELASYYEGLQQ